MSIVGLNGNKKYTDHISPFSLKELADFVLLHQLRYGGANEASTI